MFFHSKRSDNTKNSSSSMKLDVRLKKNKILHCFKRRHCEKLCCDRTSQFYICVYIQCRRRRPTDRILSFLFPAETDVLVPVFCRSTDVVVVNFVVVLKFPTASDLPISKQKEEELYAQYLEGKSQRESSWRLMHGGDKNKGG